MPQQTLRGFVQRKPQPSPREPMTTRLDVPGADVYLYKNLWTQEELDVMATELEQLLSWEARTIRVGGRLVQQARETAFYARDPTLDYRYSGIHNANAEQFPPVVERICHRIEQHLGTSFNYVLMNRYEDGSRCVGWHSDDVRDLESPEHLIASVSVGAERFFDFRLKSDHAQKVRTPLPNGTLLTMGRGCQELWEHCVPKQISLNKRVDARMDLTLAEKKRAKIRWNLTFRRVIKR